MSINQKPVNSRSIWFILKMLEVFSAKIIDGWHSGESSVVLDGRYEGWQPVGINFDVRAESSGSFKIKIGI